MLGLNFLKKYYNDDSSNSITSEIERFHVNWNPLKGIKIIVSSDDQEMLPEELKSRLIEERYLEIE